MEETPELSYYQIRCNAIGLTVERNKLCVKEHKAMPNSKIIEYPLMCEDAKTKDILIPIYTLEGEPANYYKDNSGKLIVVKKNRLKYDVTLPEMSE